MSKEEAVARALCIADGKNPDFNYDPKGIQRTDDFRWRLYIPKARAAIEAADKWDAEHNKEASDPLMLHDMKTGVLYPAPRSLSPGLDSAIQDETTSR